MVKCIMQSGKPFIDFSQHWAYQKCPWYWREIYVDQIRKYWPEKQKEDALTLGTLVHAGLEHLRTKGTVDITEAVIVKARPTPECLATARSLVSGYHQTFPNEEHTKYYCEEPLRFPLHYAMDGLAKIDSYFHVDEPTRVTGGLEGADLWLTPGWWIHEYKTKDVSRNLAWWMLDWSVNMQASYQIMALQEKIQEPVQGILVNVLEKPKPYIPKRTCKGCKDSYELRDWVPTGEGFSCPGCANVQKLDTSDKSRVPRQARFFRFLVQRDEKQLTMALQDMKIVAGEMLHQLMPLDERDMPELARTTKACVDGVYGPCEFHEPHCIAGQRAEGYNGFVKVEAFGYIK